MSIVLTVLQIVTPVFILAGIGFAWVKLGEEYRVRFVTRLTMNLGIPALVFTSLMKTRIDPDALTGVVLAGLVAYGGMTVAVFLVVRLFRLDVRTYMAPLLFGNTGNLGLPLAMFAFGELGLGYAVVIFAIMAIYSFTFGVWLVSGGGSVLKVLKEPLVSAALLGALFLWNGWQTPDWITNTLDLIGQMAIPLMLITLGVAVARLRPSGFGRALVLSMLKVLLAVAVATGAGLWFQLPAVPFAVLVLQLSTPVAVSSYLLAEKYEVNSEEVAGLVVISTLFSLVSIPVTLAFLL